LEREGSGLSGTAYLNVRRLIVHDESIEKMNIEWGLIRFRETKPEKFFAEIRRQAAISSKHFTTCNKGEYV
jgi:hypothetical protein